MTFLFQVLFTAILAFFLEQWFPYWGGLIVAFLGGLLFSGKSGARTFGGGFLGLGLLWLGYALWLSNSGGWTLSERLSETLTLPSSELLFVVVGLVGGWLGAWFAWSGFWLKRLFSKRR
ncbi:MAG: hypothetical protein AAF740_06355 [Bacteroidota bacterium]